MPEHEYDDAPLRTVLLALAALNGPHIRVTDLVCKVRTASGRQGAYRAIGRLIAAGYAVIEGDDITSLSTSRGKRAEIRLTSLGRARLRDGAGYVPVAEVHRVGTVGGFGVVYRRAWVPRPGKTR